MRIGSVLLIVRLALGAIAGRPAPLLQRACQELRQGGHDRHTGSCGGPHLCRAIRRLRGRRRLR